MISGSFQSFKRLGTTSQPDRENKHFKIVRKHAKNVPLGHFLDLFMLHIQGPEQYGMAMCCAILYKTVLYVKSPELEGKQGA